MAPTILAIDKFAGQQPLAGSKARPVSWASGLRNVTGSGGGEALQQPGRGQRPQLAPQRLRRGDQQVSQLAEPGALGIDGALASSNQCLQRRALAARAGRRGRSLAKHAARRADRVERVGLAARAALPPQLADLEHPLTADVEEARQAATEGAGSFDRERAPTGRVRLDKTERGLVAIASRRPSPRIRPRPSRANNREQVRVAVRVDTDDVIQLICKHRTSDVQPRVGDTTGVGLGWKPPAAEL